MTNMIGKMQDLRRRPYMVERGRNPGEKDARIQELQRIIEEQEKLTRELKETLNMNESLNVMKDDVSGSLNAMKEEVSGELGVAKGEILEKQGAAKEELSVKLDLIKNELAEKVHTENVKCYRNVQSLIEELDKKLEAAGNGSSLKNMKSIKRYLKASIMIGVLNLLAIAGFILYELGLFSFLPF